MPVSKSKLFINNSKSVKKLLCMPIFLEGFGIFPTFTNMFSITAQELAGIVGGTVKGNPGVSVKQSL